uniref:Uncharacterized protein n=1 Tax=Panagrellus redivivus TaxID=6233 RepID=A0A7E4UX91_PANRE
MSVPLTLNEVKLSSLTAETGDDCHLRKESNFHSYLNKLIDVSTFQHLKKSDCIRSHPSIEFDTHLEQPKY